MSGERNAARIASKYVFLEAEAMDAASGRKDGDLWVHSQVTGNVLDLSYSRIRENDMGMTS